MNFVSSLSYNTRKVNLIGLNLQKCPIHLSGNITLSLVKHRSLEKESWHPTWDAQVVNLITILLLGCDHQCSHKLNEGSKVEKFVRGKGE